MPLRLSIERPNLLRRIPSGIRRDSSFDHGCIIVNWIFHLSFFREFSPSLSHSFSLRSFSSLLTPSTSISYLRLIGLALLVYKYMRIRQATHRCGIVSFAQIITFAFLENERAAKLAIVWNVSIDWLSSLSAVLQAIIPPIQAFLNVFRQRISSIHRCDYRVHPVDQFVSNARPLDWYYLNTPHVIYLKINGYSV